MVADLNDLADAAGAALTAPFAFDSCTASVVKVCGTFFSEQEGKKINEDDLTDLLKNWVSLITGAQCPPGLKGYTVAGLVDGPAPGVPSCLYAQYQSACAPETVAPPPPRGSVVKTHDCASTTNNVPYGLTTMAVSNGVDQYNNTAKMYCTTITSKAVSNCSPSSTGCCNMNLVKAEVVINPECKSDTRRITVNGVQVPYSWGLYDSVIALKFTSLNTLTTSLAGTKLCWYVRPGACENPETYCYAADGRCQVNFFSSNNKCCPLNLV